MSIFIRKMKYFVRTRTRFLLSKILDAFLFFPVLVDIVFKTSKVLFNTVPPLKYRFEAWKVVNGLYQRFQFKLELAFARKGKPRVEDPFFDCSIIRNKDNDKKPGEKAGIFYLRFQYNVLILNGRLTKSKSSSIDVFLDNKKIKTLNCKSSSGYLTFKQNFNRKVLDHFPVSSVLTVKDGDGNLLFYKKAPSVTLNLPHGKGDLFNLMEMGVSITKKGFLTETSENIRKRQGAYLELYTKVKEFFDKEMGTPVFAMYGTLLGMYRDGDFIPGDDDFDAGFIVKSTRAKDVKKETKEIVLKLIRAGFTISLNRKGKMFRIQMKEGLKDKIHLDLRPVWFDSGNMWANLQACIPGKEEDFLPVQKAELRGVELYIPRVPEVLLEGYYGKGWKVPDPGYINDVGKNRMFIIRTLNKTLLTPGEYLNMCKELESHPTENQGLFVSTSYQSLYPLSEFND